MESSSSVEVHFGSSPNLEPLLKKSPRELAGLLFTRLNDYSWIITAKETDPRSRKAKLDRAIAYLRQEGLKPTNLYDFPAAQWADVNSGNKIVFRLPPEEVKDRDLEIGITVSQYGSRPVVRLNDWKSRDPGPPPSYDSRSITFGIWRGFDHVFTIHLPKAAFKPGVNTLTIDNVSCSGARGFISNAFVFDYIALRKRANLSSSPWGNSNVSLQT